MARTARAGAGRRLGEGLRAKGVYIACVLFLLVFIIYLLLFLRGARDRDRDRARAGDLGRKREYRTVPGAHVYHIPHTTYHIPYLVLILVL